MLVKDQFGDKWVKLNHEEEFLIFEISTRIQAGEAPRRRLERVKEKAPRASELTSFRERERPNWVPQIKLPFHHKFRPVARNFIRDRS